LERLILNRPWHLGRQHDLHDLADTLLESDSIAPTLRSLSRATLASLAAGSADVIARELLLADATGTPYPEVTAELTAILDQPAPAAPAEIGADASVALHTVVAVRDLIDWALLDPIPMGATGTVLKAEERALAHGLVVADAEVAILIHLAEVAGFVRVADRQLFATTRGVDHRDDLAAIRTELVAAARREISPSLLAVIDDAGRADQAFVLWALPLRSDAETAHLARFAESMRLLGDGIDLALPSLESRVYVLDDLSIIAPGPLDSTTIDFLDTISVPETRGLASRRRLDPALVLRTVSGGITVDTLIERLAAVSITPLSSAVTSTIADIATNGRYVTLNGTGTDTAAKASHKELGAMLLTDPRLQRLAPVKIDDLSVLYGASRMRVETALVESRYTVVSPPVERVIVEVAPAHKFVDLVERLFATGLGSSHLERALLTAGKSRSRVTLLVETSSGNKTITFEPRHVANGRVRGLDTVADVERTLPISAIIELIAVGE
jgi:hypothetical protein